MPYRPLASRAIFAAVAVGLAILMAFASDCASLVTVGDTSDVAVLFVAAVGLGQLLTAILAAIAVCVWMHCAASNLRAFGHQYLQFSPAGAAGWWFVPFANLVKPYQAMSEIVRTSDPARLGDGYGATAPTGSVGIWWGAWIASNLVANVSMRIDDPQVSSMISLVSSGLWLVAGALLITMMRSVTDHQAECDRRLQAGPAAPTPYRAAW